MHKTLLRCVCPLAVLSVDLRYHHIVVGERKRVWQVASCEARLVCFPHFEKLHFMVLGLWVALHGVLAELAFRCVLQ